MMKIAMDASFPSEGGARDIVPWQRLRPETIRTLLATDYLVGLSSREASARLRFVGPNSPPRDAASPGSAEGRSRLLAALVTAAAVALNFREWPAPWAGFAMTLLLLLAARRLLSPRIRVIRDGRKSRIAVGKLVPGDVVELSAGELIPANVRLIKSGLGRTLFYAGETADFGAALALAVVVATTGKRGTPAD